MDCRHLTPDQRKELRALLAKHAMGLSAIQKRMQERKWYTSDVAYVALTAAQEALRAAILAVVMADQLPPPPPPPRENPEPIGYPRPVTYGK